ncbi:MAG: phytanoyl-CoA dioxygenase family protein [Sneathiella sp.]
MRDVMGEEKWQALAPSLSIGAPCDVAELPLSDEMLRNTSEHFWNEGYFNIPSLLQGDEIAPVREAMLALAVADIPPVYIFLYDQPWWLFVKLNRLLRHFLGERFAALPNLWAWHLNTEGDKGWPPHRDCDAETVFGEGGAALLMSLSLWIPLTDTDEANGCMYVLPRSREKAIRAIEVLEKSNLLEARALPASAGAALGWPQDVYHWGGRYSVSAKNPRLSLSLEFQNCSFSPLAEPLFDAGNLPPFAERLALIKSQFRKYRHIDSVLSEGT